MSEDDDAGSGPGGPFTGRLLVIIGTNRSGTTWLNSLLQSHRHVSGTEYETDIFAGVADVWLKLLTHDQLPHERLVADIRTFFDEVFGAALRRSRNPAAAYFVEKTPGTALYLPYLREVYREARYIRIVRDGRDVARSMRRRYYGTRSDQANIRLWARHEALADSNLRGVDKLITVRYEALFADPVREMLQIFHLLGLANYPGLVREIARRSVQLMAPYSHELNVGTGKWRTDVSRRRLGLMYAVAGETLCRLGYLDRCELNAWRHRPEYWAGVARRLLLEHGVASRGAIRVSTGMSLDTTAAFRRSS